MPKIIKNGKEYSGVPIEVVTAWAPTADPVQVKEPLMGNVDISSLGNGTVTGAIDAVNTDLSNVKSGLTNTVTCTISTTRAGVTLSKNTGYKTGNVATVSGQLSGSTVATGTFFNIPEGFRPKQSIYVPIFFYIDNGYHVGNATIGTDGAVSCVLSSSRSSTTTFFTATYPV